MTTQAAVDHLALAAVEPVRNNMTVGLGTGRAAARAIRALGQRAHAESLTLTCVATSIASEQLATSFGLSIAPMSKTTRLDYLFDGADEVDPQLRMVKGRGGAMTRERIVARAAAKRVYLIDESKLIPRLGTRMPLPIEVLEFALASTFERIKQLGLLDAALRLADKGAPYHTDNDALVIDARIPANIDIDTLARELDATPGIIDHGLFLTEADEVIVESMTGQLRKLTRR
jgi:ribose 5-phosphate isomerase A